MTEAARVLALVPARGGSRGVPRKNVRPLCGKPLIAHTIEAARAARSTLDLVVSTEDREIAALARRLGVEVLERPAVLARDETKMVPVAVHALETLAGQGRDYAILLLLQCTAPMRTGADIDAALELLACSDAPAVISVSPVGEMHPARMYRIQNGRLRPLQSEGEAANRQDLPPVYHRNGLIYAIRTEVLLAERTFFPANAAALVTPVERAVNIDEEIDFAFAEFLMRRTHGEDPQP